MALEPMLRVHEFEIRWADNLAECGILAKPRAIGICDRSDEWFAKIAPEVKYSGVVIDGDHSPGCPLADARNALAHLEDRGVILLHDLYGDPTQEAVAYLMDAGMDCRLYTTAHGVGLLWRGDFTPPDHVTDPHIAAQNMTARMPLLANYLGRMK